MYVLRTFSRVINHLVNFVNLCMYRPTRRLRFSVISLRAVDSQFNGCLAVPTTCVFADEYAGILQFSTAPGLWNDFFLVQWNEVSLVGSNRSSTWDLQHTSTRHWLNQLLARLPSILLTPARFQAFRLIFFFSRWPKPHPTPTRGRPKFNRLTL